MVTKKTKTSAKVIEKKKPIEQVPETEPKRSARAICRYLKISPRKVRLVINTVRYQPTSRAFVTLMSINQKAARLTEKVLRSAVANAKVVGMDMERLYISDIRADGGPTMKRFMERSMGRADRIIKRTTHLSMILKEGLTAVKAPPTAAGQLEAPKEQDGKASKAVGPKKKMKAAAKA